MLAKSLRSYTLEKFAQTVKQMQKPALVTGFFLHLQKKLKSTLV